MDYDELLRQGKVKKIFRAKRKLTRPNLISHITQHAAGKDPLFIEDSDYLFMLSNLKDVSQNRSLEVYTFCLMPNHIHLLVRPREDELNEPMRDLFSRYASMFNKKYERKGHLFAGPYRQSVCLDDSYLLAASLYIHMNPARAGLVTNPLKYQWSSVKLYVDQNISHSFVDPNFVLGTLAKARYQQREIYRNLLNEGLALLEGDVLEKSDVITKLRKALIQFFPAVFSGVDKRRQIARYTGIDLLSEEQLDRRVLDMKAGMPILSTETKKARRFLVEQLIARGYKRDEIADRLGMSVKTIYNILKVAG